MSVIARKIASAAVTDSEPVRSDALDAAQPFYKDLAFALNAWLGMEEAETALLQAAWEFRSPDTMPGPVVICRGPQRSRRIAFSTTPPLAELSARKMLELETPLEEADRAALQPFVEQNLLSLGEGLNRSASLSQIGVSDPEWCVEAAEKVEPEFTRCKGLTLELSFLEGDGEDMRIILMVTEDMIIDPTVQEGEAVKQEETRLPPRLGPCHVEVQAVADQVQMSVADCTRLEIGHTVALPGLQFDRLQLTVEMGDGPQPLTEASLGADRGVKAVRLNRGLDPAFRVAPDGALPVHSDCRGVPA